MSRARGRALDDLVGRPWGPMPTSAAGAVVDLGDSLGRGRALLLASTGRPAWTLDYDLYIFPAFTRLAQ